MRKFIIGWGVVLLVVGCGGADPLPRQAGSEAVSETWDAAYIEGAKAGYCHTTVHELERDGKKVLRTTLAMNLTVRRYNSVVPLKIETSTDETLDGKVLGLSLTQYLDKGKKVEQTAQVEDDQLVIRTTNAADEKKVPWNKDAIGLYQQQRIFQLRKVNPGDRFEYLNYELAIPIVTTVRVTVQQPETVDVLVGHKVGMRTVPERAKQNLLRVEAQADKVKLGSGEISLPKLVSWLDKDLLVMRSEMELPGVGRITLYRTTQAVAEEAGVAPALLPDIGLTTLIPIKQTIDRPHEASTIVYRIAIKGDADPATTFARDARQEVQNVKDHTFELHVKAVREPAAVANPEPAKDEFLKSNAFLDSADDKVQALAQRAVGEESDPWNRAKRIEKWVHDHMTPSSSIGFATAGQIARDLRGDCRQHAMLSAAMCRAAGLPSRTAVGLIYVHDPDRGPVLGFHMWTEVWIKGQWLALDATLGRGGIGAGHLKIADHSWYNTQTLAPLLPVTRVIGKITVDVVSVK
jgi:hypothetical protein